MMDVAMFCHKIQKFEKMDLERLRVMEYNLRALLRSLKTSLANTPNEDPNKTLEAGVYVIENTFEEFNGESNEWKRLLNVYRFLDIIVTMMEAHPRTAAIAAPIRIAMSHEGRLEF